MRWSTAATATGTTCTMRGNLWSSTAASGSPDSAGISYVTTSGTTCTSAGQTMCWGENRPRYTRGPTRRAGFGYLCRHEDYESDRRESRINREQRRKLELMKKKANDVSLKLLKSWLSKLEYEYLMEQGQLELPSQYEKDVIYIVKKDTYEKVKIATKKKLPCISKPVITETAEACINVGSEYPVGDNLLAKIMLLKSDEKQFLEIANISRYHTPFPRNYNPRISIADFAGLLIREVAGTQFWFVQFDIDNRERPDAVNHCHETDRWLQFPREALVVPSDNDGFRGMYNDIRLPSVGQYFINANTMDEAVKIARHWRHLDSIENPDRNPIRMIGDALGEMGHQIAHGLARAMAEPEPPEPPVQEQEYAGGITLTWDTNNDALVRYANSTEQEDEQQYYTTTRLGYEESR